MTDRVAGDVSWARFHNAVEHHRCRTALLVHYLESARQAAGRGPAPGGGLSRSGDVLASCAARLVETDGRLEHLMTELENALQVMQSSAAEHEQGSGPPHAPADRAFPLTAGHPRPPFSHPGPAPRAS